MNSDKLIDTFSSLVELSKFGLSNAHFDINEKIYFDNGYGASIVKGAGTFGYEQDQYELALINWYGELQYDTPICDDVVGYLTESDVNKLIKKIKKLPALDLVNSNMKPEDRSLGRYPEVFGN